MLDRPWAAYIRQVDNIYIYIYFFFPSFAGILFEIPILIAPSPPPPLPPPRRVLDFGFRAVKSYLVSAILNQTINYKR